ncbi:hypothetical protein Y032_0085g1862 [Ancylostoma ceylanicum]|uniref:Uncharacterized protein n=1 Tax=Ancylostoma ceylanicum TaxID=53326 RepID=A0A016TQA5_9BILA|nr:hypothetical protein Y032_0085g1862 [Ancylostoma ceylanicum]
MEEALATKHGKYSAMCYRILGTEETYTFSFKRISKDHQLHQCHQCKNKRERTETRMIGNPISKVSRLPDGSMFVHPLFLTVSKLRNPLWRELRRILTVINKQLLTVNLYKSTGPTKPTLHVYYNRNTIQMATRNGLYTLVGDGVHSLQPRQLKRKYQYIMHILVTMCSRTLLSGLRAPLSTGLKQTDRIDLPPFLKGARKSFEVEAWQLNRYEGLEELRRTKKPLPTMLLKEQAVGEEQNASVRGLVFDSDGTAPVLYRIKSLFGSGAELESVHFEVPRLAATAAQLREPTVWRTARFALIHRELRRTPGSVLNISPPPAPAGIRNNSEEHQKLVENKLFKSCLGPVPNPYQEEDGMGCRPHDSRSVRN